MKSLGNSHDKVEVLGRLELLSPESERRWGRMSAHQMVCHLSDSFRSALGDRPASPMSNPLSRTVVKWIALYAPIEWPHGVQTRPEVDQESGGTTPVSFRTDVTDLVDLIDRFASKSSELDGRAHSMFGALTPSQWYRWGYLHVDHHLRQFGR